MFDETPLRQWVMACSCRIQVHTVAHADLFDRSLMENLQFFLYTFTHLRIRACIHMSIHMSIQTSIHMSTHMSIQVRFVDQADLFDRSLMENLKFGNNFEVGLTLL